MKFYKAILAILLILIVENSIAQVEKNSVLFIELKKADSLTFDEGFNKCNYSALKKVLHKDLEFFHDLGGSQNLEQFYKAFSKNICGDSKYKPIRKLLPETLEVYPLRNNKKLYGAIQKGEHNFYIKEQNKDIYITGYAKFITTWIIENGNWKAKRILSYDHKPVKDYGEKFNANYAFPLFDNDKKIEELLTKHKIPSIALGVIKNGSLQQIRTFGNKKSGQPISSNSIYKVASLTKPITAFVVLKLIDEGVLDLDEPVSRYFIDEDIKDSKYLNKLTTRHILSHQSGFPNWRYLSDDNKLFFQFEPGTKWQYSGEGFEYLRRAVEKKLNHPFEEIAQEKLFNPLGMNNTHYYWTDKIDEKQYAVEHDKNGKPINYEKYTDANASANLLTTVEDYSKFLVHILNGAGLSKKNYSEFLKVQAQEKKGIDWSLGMQMLSDLPNNETAFMHTGGDYGTKTIVIIFKNSKDGLVLFSNSENGMILWQKVISEYFGEIGEEIVRRNLE
ncbi:class A beta-lactamase-related serine hydrolase [Aquimarina sp. ERC-38]|uniref:class A beta-lactamase-related serine hydrolase n=1 Tax=Aquimarina sp. ERC-38 TaxID=2949996 RepID=UPI0022481BDD|nr:class A beta-lactamase-related serine hydrolase [Aquimarina sp. ERC-38]UZO80628.1 class A beta-lactamase-related serine hydrolase [Aquimarina sp. ERC-38]